jgi:Protein kinase domain
MGGLGSDPRVGTRLLGYRIEELLGRGGMGVVYRAEHLGLGRKVALKVLAPDLAENDSFRRRFIRESRMAARLDHPNILPIYEAGEADGLLFIAMRYVQGSDLHEVLDREGLLEPHRAVGLLYQVAAALDAAHRGGLVHRDVKPANILIAPELGPGSTEHCYLCDFGLLKTFDSRDDLTRTGQFVGTIPYVAPEQIEGRAVDRRTDVYALGCVLFHCLTGAVPYDRETDVAVVYAHLQDPPPSAHRLRPELPAGFDEVVARALAKAPGDRFDTATALMEAARGVLYPHLRTRPWSPAPPPTAEEETLPGTGAAAEAGTVPGAAAPAPRVLAEPPLAVGASLTAAPPSGGSRSETGPAQQERDVGTAAVALPAGQSAVAPRSTGDRPAGDDPMPTATLPAQPPGDRLPPVRSPVRPPRVQRLVTVLTVLVLLSALAAGGLLVADRLGYLPGGARAGSQQVGSDLAQPGSFGGNASATCRSGWQVPAPQTPSRTEPLNHIRTTMGVGGAFLVAEMRHFRGPDGSLWWYVKARRQDDESFQARWLVVRRPDGARRIVAVAPYATEGLRSPDWLAFSGQGAARRHPGLPGRWRGSAVDFVAAGGLPGTVRGCLAGT